MKRRHRDAAIGQEHIGQQHDAFARRGQRAQDGEIPEEQLQQQRNIAEDLDIDGCEFRHEPIARQPRHADDETERHREDRADDRDQQCIGEADEENAAIGRFFAIGDQRLDDAETCRVIHEAEAGRDVLAFEIGPRGQCEKSENCNRGGNRTELIDERAQTRVGPRHRAEAFVFIRWSHVPAPRVVQRIGGAYISPPFFHSAFSPRGMPSGVSGPTVRLYISP